MSLEVSSYARRYVSSSSAASLLTHGPSGRLPIELLSEIFLLCMDNKMDDVNTIRIPLLLSKICSRWRSAAINNPRLWSRLSVHLPLVTFSSSASRHLAQALRRLSAHHIRLLGRSAVRRFAHDPRQAHGPLRTVENHVFLPSVPRLCFV
jgi:hypothetical protein